MKRSFLSPTAGLLLAVLASSISLVCQAGTADYSVKFLTPLSGNVSNALAINNAGQIAGSGSFDQYGWQVPTIWIAGVAKSLTGTSPTGAAFAINELGQAAGALDVLSNGAEAAYWLNGKSNLLGVYGGGADWDRSAALSINDARQAVGYSRGADFVVRATLWENGSMTALPNIGGIGNWANAINQSGQIVGFGRTSDNAIHATLWLDGAVTDLGTLGGTESAAYGINDLGHVVGNSQTAGNEAFVATRWQDGHMTALESLGGNYSKALAINLSGLAVGFSQAGDGLYDGHAVLWDGTEVTDLNKFLAPQLAAQGWILNTALDVNDSGYIVGQAFNQNTFQTLGFVLTPVPEPSACLMVVLGIGFLLGRRGVWGRARA